MELSSIDYICLTIEDMQLSNSTTIFIAIILPFLQSMSGVRIGDLLLLTINIIVDNISIH